jgi:hypothetical protein
MARLRFSRWRLEIVGDPTGGKIEQRDQGTALHFRIMAAAGIGRRPPRPLPTLQPPEFGALIEWDHHVQFTIGVAVILAAQHLVVVLILETPGVLAVHVYTAVILNWRVSGEGSAILLRR